MAIREYIHWNRPWNRPSFSNARNKHGYGLTLSSLQDDMNRLFDHFSRGVEIHLTDWDEKYADAPPINVVEKENSFSIKAELAGINPDDVDLRIRDGFLTLSGERREEKEELDNGGRYLCHELSSGFFQRVIELPEAADCEKAEASFRNGILTVTVPKKAEAAQKPKKLQIRKAG
jgi:HSP20 family protein